MVLKTFRRGWEHLTKNYLRTLLTAGALTLGGAVFAQQQSDVSVTLKRPDGANATGTVSIVGQDTAISDPNFVSSKNYVLKNATSIEDVVDDGKGIFVAGNPTNQGRTQLKFVGYDHLDDEATVYAHSLNGSRQAQAKIKDGSITFNTQPGMIFIQYVGKDHKETFKVINNSNVFSMDFVLDNYVSLPKSSTGQIKKDGGTKGTAGPDDYVFTFTDPALNIENHSENFYAPLGITHTIDEVLDWTAKNIRHSARTNTNTTVRMKRFSDGTILDEATTESGTLQTQTTPVRFNNDTGIELEYELLSPFTDTVKIRSTQYRNDEFVIDTLRNGWFYQTITGNGATYVIKKDGSIIVPATPVGQQSLFKMQGDEASIVFEVSGTGLETKVVPATLQKGENTQIISLNPAAYSHTITGSVASSISGKRVKDATPIYISKAPGDTAFVATIGEQFTYSWNDNNPTVSVKIGSRAVGGHVAGEITKVIDDNEPAGIVFQGRTYSLSQPVLIQNQTNEGVPNVSISGGDGIITTNLQGLATLIRSNLPTDINNIPFANYTTNISCTCPNIETLNAAWTSVFGENPQIVQRVNQKYTHLVSGEFLSSIAGKTIKDGTDAYIAKGDTLWTKIANRAFSFSWTDLHKTITARVGARLVPGHQPNSAQVNADDSESINVTFTGSNYSASQPIRVINQTSENVPNVSIAGGDAVVVTNTSGVATLVRSNLATDANNVPFANYVTSVSLTGTNIQPFTSTVTSVPGMNAETTKQVNQLYSHDALGIFRSSKSDKSIIDGTDVYLAKGDTIWAKTVEQYAVFSWTDLNKTVNARVGARTVAGHVPTFTQRTIDDDETVMVTFEGLNYSLSQPVIVRDQNLAAVGAATVAGGDAPVQTATDGTATYTKNNLATDAYNRPLSNYPTAVVVSKSGYQTLNTTVNSVAGTNPQRQLDVIKDAVGTVHDFTWIVKDINGDVVRDLTQKIEWNGDGHVQYVTPDANGVIHIHREETGTPSTKLKVSNTSVKYSDFQVWRDWSRPVEEVLRDTNYCQIQNFATSKFAELNLTGVPAELTQYVAKEKVKTPDPVVGTYGDSISIYHPVVRDMMGGRNMDMTTKFVSTPSQPSIEAVRFTMNYNTGAPIDPTNLNRQELVWNNVQNIYTLNDGKKLINIINFVLNSRSDSKWQEIIARGYKNCVRTYFYDSSQENVVNRTLIESPNGDYIINDGFGRYNTGTTTGIMLAEIYQSFSNNKDPPSGGTGQFVSTVSGNVTPFGTAMARLIYLLNPGTKTF